MLTWLMNMGLAAGPAFMEGGESIALVQDTSAVVKVVIGSGAPVDAGDTLFIRYERAPGLFVSGISQSLTAASPGDVFTFSLTSLTPNSPLTYMVTWHDDSEGTDSEGATRNFHTQPGVDQPFSFIATGDGHNLNVQKNENAGRRNPSNVMANTMKNILAERGPRDDLPHFWMEPGDTAPYANHGQDNNAFPIKLTGEPTDAGDPEGAADKPYASQEGQQDCERLMRIFRKQYTPIHSIPLYMCGGNHDGRAWWHYVANHTIGDGHDLAADSVAAYDSHLGAPPGSGIYGGDSSGRWYSFQWGAALIVVLDVYVDTEHVSGKPSAHDLPQNPGDEDEWTLGTTQYDWLFNSSDGILSKPSGGWKWAIVFMHNLIGGKHTTPDNYGRGGKRYVLDSIASKPTFEHGAGAAWTNPNSYTGDHASLGFHQSLTKHRDLNDYEVVVFKGHDHFYAREKVNGIPYLTMPQPAGCHTDNHNDAVYGNGFINQGDYIDDARDTFYASNAGHVHVTVTPDFLEVEYIRSYIGGLTYSGGAVADPTDGVVTNGAVVDRMLMAHGQNRIVYNRKDLQPSGGVEQGYIP